MDHGTEIGGGEDRFRTTHLSALEAARSAQPQERTRGFSVLVSVYWKPVYKYIRLKWGKSNEDAKDLTQGFFAAAFEKDFFASYDPAKARFRTFLRTCVDGFVANQDKAAGRIKRGGRDVLLSLDFADAESEFRQAEAVSPETVEDYFNREWVRSLFAVAVETLRAECRAAGKEIHYQLFEAYDLDGADAGQQSYAELSARFAIPVTQVTNHLAFARREFRRILLGKLREVTGSDQEYRRELRTLLGVEPS